MSDVGQQINLQEQNTMKSKACLTFVKSLNSVEKIWKIAFASFSFSFFFLQGSDAVGLAQSAERLKALHHVLRMLGFWWSSVIILKTLAQTFSCLSSG